MLTDDNSRPAGPLRSAAAARLTRFDLLAALLLLGLGLAVYLPVLGLQPLRGDNLYVMAWADRSSLDDLWRLDPAIYPEWRPLAYQTVWLSHQIIALDQVWLHHLLNLLLWAGCGWMVYLLVRELSGSRAAGVLAGAILIVDSRSLQSMLWIVERQTTLACILGLYALLLVVRAQQRTLTRGEMAAVALLLLGAALGKEHGLAFAGATVAFGALSRRRDLALSGLAALAAYGTLRLAAAGGALGGAYCEEMGYFFDVHLRCTAPLTATMAKQMVYNMAVTGVGILWQGTIGDRGMIYLESGRMMLGLVLLASAVAGFVLGGPRVRVFALVIAGNAVLAFMLHRHRNVLIGMSAMMVVAGTGLGFLKTALARQQLAAPVRAAVVAACIIFVWYEAKDTRGMAESEAAVLLAQEPCGSSLRGPAQIDAFIREVKTTFGLKDPDCVETPAAY